MLDVLFELLIEIAGQLLFAIGGAVLSEAISDHEQADPVLAAIGHALMGGSPVRSVLRCCTAE